MTLIDLSSLISAAIGLPLAVYCFVLSRRLRRLNDLETGLGGAIAVMTAEISRLEGAILKARDEAAEASGHLTRNIETARSEKAFWALQAELARAGRAAPARRLRPRQSERAENA
ncbi:MAG: hypothetical protein Q4G36_06410 [Paracoccus sp. (in: a-proteobacteria)]|nr:hypothetical protein [Paracoccus sp. (in: a-proteobacteria)]